MATTSPAVDVTPDDRDPTRVGPTVRLPNFLVIGGMKCGSTTMYHDLIAHPRIQVPEKELNILAAVGCSTSELRARYAAAYKQGSSDTVRGDVSTVYSMLPDIPQVADRAGQLLSPDLKIIYLVRHPIQRLISHHYHAYSEIGPCRMSGDIDQCVRDHPSLVNYSRYVWQLRPWRACFGDAAIRVVIFEEYIRNRSQTASELYQFLGLDPAMARVAEDARFNVSDGKPVFTSFWEKVSRHRLYRNAVRPWLSPQFRRRVMNRILPSAPPRPAPPSATTYRRLAAVFRNEVRELSDFLGRPIDWQLD